LIRTLLAIYLFTFVSVAHAEQYFCVADSSVGFSYNPSNIKWEQASFNVSDKKYIISKRTPDSPEPVFQVAGEFQVMRVGENNPIAQCKQGFNENGFLQCDGIFGEIRFNKDNGRYILSYLGGYFNVVPGKNKITDSTSDTPLIEIGKCSPL
jgi:hypothetical protein